MKPIAFLLTIAWSSLLLAGNESQPVGEAVAERPTLHSLGAYWIIRGDDNKNATVTLEYREAGKTWKKGLSLFRVEKGAHVDKDHGSKINLPDGAWLFAGSAVMLEPNTEYELKLKLSDPDGGEGEQTLAVRTRAEPTAREGPVHYVVPGKGGGSGTKQDPYKGFEAAQSNAKPGDTFLLGAGNYEGPFTVNRPGEAGKPIIWRGVGNGKSVILGKGADKAGPIVNASDSSHVWFEDLTFRMGEYAIVAHDSDNLVVRRCEIYDVHYGITATRNTKGDVEDHFIVDNVMEGPSTWPRTKGIEDARGVQVSGAGHVVAYNRIRGFADAVDTFPSPRCEAIDFHNNDISEMTDDGIETDYAQRNVRVFDNRMINVFQGITTQPVWGGPVYIWRNVMYNVCVSPFKLHNSPSGVLLFHNTVVKDEYPFELWSPAPLRNTVFRNNLWVGTRTKYAFESSTPMVDCDLDYDGFAGGPFDNFLKFNNQAYATIDEVRRKAPVYKNVVAVNVKGLFASGITPPTNENTEYRFKSFDLRLSKGSEAVDAGQVIPGFNDGFDGRGPDLGAYEGGQKLPQYGPRKKN